MSALVGLSRAKRMVILGERLDALTLEAWGLIDEVCEPGDLKKRSMASLSDTQRNPSGRTNDQADAESSGWRAGREHFAHGRRPEPAHRDYG